jgi:hypothetical protein
MINERQNKVDILVDQIKDSGVVADLDNKGSVVCF